MYKEIPGNNKYLIDLDRNIIDKDNIAVFKDKRINIKIELFGEINTVSREWLSLFAHFECGAIENISENFNKIKFSKIENRHMKTVSNRVMYFTSPIYHNKKFRIIPNFPNYAVDRRGIVVRVKDNKVIKSYIKADNIAYCSVRVYSPDKGGEFRFPLHRLVAYAWVMNDNFRENYIVNHIDGIKYHNDYTNLEWCSVKDNNIHAVGAGLCKDNVKCIVKDHLTGKIDIFPSLRAFFKTALNTNCVSYVLSKSAGYLYRKRYEIKEYSKDVVWSKDLLEDGVDSNNKYLVTVRERNTGNVKKFSSIKTLIKEYKLWNISNSIPLLVSELNSRRKDLEVGYQLLHIKGPYRVYNVKTKKTFIVENIRDICRMTGVGFMIMQTDLSHRCKFIYDGTWCVRPVNEGKIVEKDYTHKRKRSFSIEAKHLETDKVLTFESLREVSRYFKVDRSVITTRIKNGCDYRNWIFKKA